VKTPLVSVCMPAYNAERWIGAAIESVLDQTQGDFELVISNNASTDATEEIARSYGDPRIRIERTPKLIAAVSNQSRAVALSTGRFVKFLHADDKLSPTCLEEMAGLALEDPAIGFVFAPREVLLEDPGEDDLVWARVHGRLHDRFRALDRINDGHLLFRQMLDEGFDGNWIGEPTAVLASRACLAEVGLFNPRLHQIADLDLWLRIMLTYRVGYIPHALAVYRHHGGSETAANARLRLDWLDRLWLLEGLLRDPRLLDSDARASVGRLRRDALKRARRAQVRRLLYFRFSPSLLSYDAYRVRARTGSPPALHDSLPPPAAVPAPTRETPASADPAQR
jgi:glycosyltransferase involved in cell wall biosynthesis